MKTRGLKSSILAIAVAGIANALAPSTLSPGERKLRELFNSGGPQWRRAHPYSTTRRTGAAAIKRAARRLRNIRARAAK